LDDFNETLEENEIIERHEIEIEFFFIHLFENIKNFCFHLFNEIDNYLYDFNQFLDNMTIIDYIDLIMLLLIIIRGLNIIIPFLKFLIEI
jgi:hypothetical protein